MNKLKKLAAFVLTMTVFVFALTAFAQVTNVIPSEPGSTPAPVDMSIMWNALVVALVPVVVAGIKKLTPNIPKVAWPVGAALLGILSNWILAKAGALPHSSWELGALCGAAAVGVREIADQAFSTTKQLLSKFTGNTPAPPTRSR